MQSAYSAFVGKLEESARLHLRRQLEANTSQFTLNGLMARLEDMDNVPRALGLSLANQVDLEEEGADDVEEERAETPPRARPLLCEVAACLTAPQCLPTASTRSPCFGQELLHTRLRRCHQQIAVGCTTVAHACAHLRSATAPQSAHDVSHTEQEPDRGRRLCSSQSRDPSRARRERAGAALCQRPPWRSQRHLGVR